jgi:hypothetical protein
MKKQTAVEWLIEQIGWYNIELSSELRFEIDKAKAMEKEQIVDAYLQGESDADHYDDSAFRYYNETYGGDK